MMSESDSPLLMNQSDEIWTEEEVIEFGLAGEEEYCDLETVETSIELPTMPEVMETAELVYLDDADSVLPEPDGCTTKKSGRMRKKSARLMEMEQSDPLEQQILHRQSRTNARKSRGSEHIVREIPASSLSDGNPVSPGFDKPVKVRFSLGVKQDEVDVTPKSRQRRDRRKLAAEVKMESDEELVVDEPTAVISPPSSEPSLVLRMKLNMDSSASFGSMDTQDSRHHSPKKSKRSLRMKVEEEQILLSDAAVGGGQPLHKNMSVGGISHTHVDFNVGRFPATQRRQRKRSHDDVLSDEQIGATFGETDSLPVIQRAYSLKAAKQPKDTSKPKKKRQKGYTAYMLWCGTQRLKLMSVNPGIDFATLSKTLGDMWQTVPEKEKMIWRRKARKMAKKGSSVISTGRVKDGVPMRGRPPGAHSGMRGRPPLHGVKHHQSSALDDASSLRYKVVGTGPLDAAAHLKLLGESLSVIGARLQEHKGQIAVQGSLSVLLDSMLCALGPLMCLTTQVPELNGCEERIHASTLNNIAYIMPGVG